MAITATFLADFTQFNGAVQGAGGKLREFEDDAEKAGGAVKKVDKSAQESASALSGLEKMVVQAFTARAVINFGTEIIKTGSNIEKMAAQMGVGTDEVQRFMHIAGQSDTSVQTLVSAVQNLQQRLGDDSTGAAGAMRKLGINLGEFGKLGTYQQVLQLSDALRSETDTNERASAGAAIFGKTWKEVGPAITSNMRAIGDAAPLMADATVKSLDRIDDAMNRARAQAVAWGGTLVQYIESVGFNFGQLLSTLNTEHFGQTTEDFHKAAVALNDPDGLIRALEKAKPPAVALDDGIKALGLTASEAATLERELTFSAEESIRVNQKAAAETDKVTEAIKRQMAAQSTFLELILPGTSKLAELERSRAVQAGQDNKFTAEGLKTLRFLEEGLGTVQQNRATGALAMHLAEQTAIREQAEALALVELQTTENMLVVGQYANANRTAGDVAKAATGDAVAGYAAVAQQVTMTGDAIRAMIELSKYSAAANAIYSENKLFTTRDQLRRVSQIPTGGGTTNNVNVNVSGVFDANAKRQLTDAVSEGLTRSVLQGSKVG